MLTQHAVNKTNILIIKKKDKDISSTVNDMSLASRRLSNHSSPAIF